MREFTSGGLDFICANPDLVVEIDGSLSYCAGAIAERYAQIGGKVIQAGKPFAPIYERALALASEFAVAPIERSRVLAIGDAMRTDIKGAFEQGFASLFVTRAFIAQNCTARKKALASTPPLCGNSWKPAASRPTAALAELVW